MGRMKELKITIDKIVLTITVILAVIWLILTIMICKDLRKLQEENKQLQWNGKKLDKSLKGKNK